MVSAVFPESENMINSVCCANILDPLYSMIFLMLDHSYSQNSTSANVWPRKGNCQKRTMILKSTELMNMCNWQNLPNEDRKTKLELLIRCRPILFVSLNTDETYKTKEFNIHDNGTCFILSIKNALFWAFSIISQAIFKAPPGLKKILRIKII